jgi:hypothetical protein
VIESATATTNPAAATEPSFARVQISALPSPELNQAIMPAVMADLLPRLRAAAGFLGFVYSGVDDDDAASLTLTLVDDAPALEELSAIQDAWEAGLDPRLAIEPSLAVDGPVRMFALSSRPASDLPPFLHGTFLTMRDQTNAPGVDIEAAIAIARETLIPLFLEQPGFLLYCWVQREGGRLAINIWETLEDAAAGDEALVAWRDEHFTTPTSSETVTTTGTVVYAEMP